MHCIVIHKSLSNHYLVIISSILRRTYSEQISSNFIMHSTLCIMHCKAFFEPPSNHLRITSEQPKTQKYPKYGENSIHYAFFIMHYTLHYAFFIMHSSLNTPPQNRNGISGIEMAESSKRCIFCNK